LNGLKNTITPVSCSKIYFWFLVFKIDIVFLTIYFLKINAELIYKIYSFKQKNYY